MIKGIQMNAWASADHINTMQDFSIMTYGGQVSVAKKSQNCN